MNLLNNNIYDNLFLLPEDLDGWNGNSEVFGDLIRETLPSVIVEVGSWKGQSSINMARTCKKLGLKTKIYCIDTWLGALEFWDTLKDTPERDLMLKNGYPQIYYQFLSNVDHNGVNNFIIPVPMPSNIGLKLLHKQGIKADLIYIDGSHDYVDVSSDINMSLKLFPDAIVCGDDLLWPDVQKALWEACSQYALTLNTLDNFWRLNR
jgi:predicted O-methyltransferase YrrM